MSWNDEFDKEHAKKDNFLDFPEKENPIPNNNGEILEQSRQETEQVDIHDEEKQSLKYDIPNDNNQNTIHYGTEYQPQPENNQNFLEKSGEYQSKIENGQNVFNQMEGYQPKVDNSQDIFNQAGQYQPQVENGQKLFSQSQNVQNKLEGQHVQNTFQYGAEYQPQGGNGQNSFNYGGEYQIKGNIAGQKYSSGEPSNSTNGLAIAAFIIGLISVFSSCCFGGVLGIVSLILGIVSLSKRGDGKVFSIIGIVLSIVSMLITILTTIVLIICLNTSDDADGYGDLVSNVEVASVTVENIFEEKTFNWVDQSEFSFDLEEGYVYYFNHTDDKENNYQCAYTYYNDKKAALHG